MNSSPPISMADSSAADLTAWDRRFGALLAQPGRAGLAEELLALAAALEQAREAGAEVEACDQRWQRLAQLSSVYRVGVQVAVHRCLRWLVILLSVILPPSLVAAVYGMNFSPHVSPWSMPELFFYWGYPAVLLIMGGLMVLSVLALRRARGLTLPGTLGARSRTRGE